MNKFDSTINEKLAQFGETLDTSSIKQMLAQINGVVTTLPSSDKGQIMQVMTSLKDVGGRLDFQPVKPVFGGAAGGSSPAAAGASTAGGTSSTGTAGTSTATGGTNSTGGTSSAAAQQQAGTSGVQKIEQDTANKAVRNSEITGYNKETGYAKG